MNKSESIAALAAALAKAQGQIRGAVKDSSNPFFKSKYADLASVVEAIRAAFSANGLSYTQVVEPSEKDEVRVETVILHSSGEWFSCGILALPVSKVDAQGYGSALTYARRYSLSAAVGVAPEDDDGNAAVKAAPELKGMDEGTLADFQAAISTASTIEELQKVYGDAYNAAREAGDKPAMRSLMNEKDVRKKALGVR